MPFAALPLSIAVAGISSRVLWVSEELLHDNLPASSPEAHLIHQTTDQKDPSSPVPQQVAALDGVGNRAGVEAFSWIPDRNQNAGRLQATNRYQNRLPAITAASVINGVDQCLMKSQPDIGLLAGIGTRFQDQVLHEIDNQGNLVQIGCHAQIQVQHAGVPPRRAVI